MQVTEDIIPRVKHADIDELLPPRPKNAYIRPLIGIFLGAVIVAAVIWGTKLSERDMSQGWFRLEPVAGKPDGDRTLLGDIAEDASEDGQGHMSSGWYRLEPVAGKPFGEAKGDGWYRLVPVDYDPFADPMEPQGTKPQSARGGGRPERRSGRCSATSGRAWRKSGVICSRFRRVSNVRTSQDDPFHTGPAEPLRAARPKSRPPTGTAVEASRVGTGRRPAPGTGLLSRQEAYWCEGITLGLNHARKHAEAASRASVDQFNKDVRKFNRHCSERTAYETSWSAGKARATRHDAWWRKNYRKELWK